MLAKKVYFKSCVAIYILCHGREFQVVANGAMERLMLLSSTAVDFKGRFAGEFLQQNLGILACNLVWRLTSGVRDAVINDKSSLLRINAWMGKKHIEDLDIIVLCSEMKSCAFRGDKVDVDSWLGNQQSYNYPIVVERLVVYD
jgi:hypothetical protein